MFVAKLGDCMPSEEIVLPATESVPVFQSDLPIDVKLERARTELLDLSAQIVFSAHAGQERFSLRARLLQDGIKYSLRPLPLVEEGLHVGGQILDDGQILERPNLEPTVLDYTRDVRAAGPARPSVHGHGAGAAHAHAAGKAVRQRRVEMTLNERHDVEHGLVFAPGDLVSLVSSLLRAAPERHGQLGSCIGHRFLGRFLAGVLGPPSLRSNAQQEPPTL